MALELRAAGARMRELCNVVVGIYGTESRVAFSFSRAADSIDRLRHELQMQVSLDWPESEKDRIYF